jgi:hypothetical protein
MITVLLLHSEVLGHVVLLDVPDGTHHQVVEPRELARLVRPSRGINMAHLSFQSTFLSSTSP